KDGKPLTPEEFTALSEGERRAVDQKRESLMSRVQSTLETLRSIETETLNQVRALERSAAEGGLAYIFTEAQRQGQQQEVVNFLQALKEYTLNNLRLFQESQDQPPPTQPLGPPQPPGSQRNPFLPYEVNLLVDNSAVQNVPVIIESNPTWGNLFGRIERRAVMGTYLSDHTMLKPGGVHRANGGYLILNVRDALMNAGVWEGLKRVIRNQEARLEDPFEQFGFLAPQALRPQPIPLDIKVVLTGDEATYRLLYTYDQEDLWELFKVKAEFDYQINLTQENISAYCNFICAVCKTEGLLPFDREGAAQVVEYGARLVSDQGKLSSRFGVVKDLLIEADYWARRDGSSMVGGSHVKKALEERVYRHNLIEERLRSLTSQGTIMVDLQGSVVGQINGLVVYDLGDFSFGRPARITVKTFAGSKGVVNIERESQLSGRIHDKGVLILSGYLGWKYAQERPLSLSASISFEQSYEGVEGDSASSTELYAILSSLSELPLKQNIAVTGSVNQKGEIQPIGGVNQKVEGFFDLCRLSGLTGDQGVIIPHQNVRNLMLRQDVVEAVEQGKFHVYAVETIDQGMEALTGVQAGERQPDGVYSQGTVNYLVDKRLKELGESMRGYYGAMLGEPVA
ncbi:MAG: ATP-binding protein, partial [Dehalococcoidia bacterium]